MKLVTILLLIGTLHLSAAGYSQNVTISRNNATLETVFKDIKKQTGYLFFYNEKVSAISQKQDVDLKNVSLEQALAVCLKNYALTYTIVNKTIVIREKTAENHSNSLLNIQSAAVQSILISGKVIDSTTKATLPGVNVSTKSRTVHTQTDNDGNFKLLAQPGDVLVFSFIGYKTKEIIVRDNSTLTVALATKINNMNDVVVTGYQTIKKDNYSGNAIVIKGEDLKKNNPQNILKSVQAFDPSFRILDNNIVGSDPNALPKINVRGATALPSITDKVDRNNLTSSYNLPTFILDGFEVTLQKVFDLDINRIETVTLLKDAAATAVYGSRAANGVMVITTKAPQAGKLQLSYNYELNFTAPDLSDYHVLNATDKLRYETLAGLYTTNNSTAYTQEQVDARYFNILKNVVSGVNTYWLSQPLQNTYGQKHSLYIQGGDTTFRYGVDLRYQSQPGVMKGSTRDRYSGGMNFTYNPSKKLIFRNDLTATQVKGVDSPYGSFSNYARMNPYYPKTDSIGNYIQEVGRWRIDTHQVGDKQYQNVNVFNPLYDANLGSFSKSSYLELLDNFSVDWRFSPAFRIKGLISLNKTISTADQFTSPSNSFYYNYSTVDLNKRGFYYYENNDGTTVDGNVTINYNKVINDHALNFVAGANVVSSRYDFKSVSAQGFSNDRFTNIGFARTYQENSAPGGDVTVKRTAGLLFSGNYSYKNKYLLDGSFRYEGSSSFGSNDRFAPFWAAGAGWNIHNESFLAGNKIISQLRLKTSTGILGSVAFPPYLSRSIYSYQSSNWYSTGIGAFVDNYGNSSLAWQKTTTYDAGMDLGLLHDRIVLSPRYYYKLTKGLITDINLAPSTGFTTYKENLGDMSNKGYELYLQANVYKAHNWNININGNLTHNTNKLINFSNALKAFNSHIDDVQTDPNNGLLSTPLLRYEEGQSLNTIYAVKSLGIDPENGKEILVKKDGTLTYVWDVKDMQPVGNTTPKAEGFFGTNITYKSFLLSCSFHYRFGGQAYNQTLVDRVENADPRFNVDSRVLTERWIKPGDVSLYKNIADVGTTYASSRFVQKDNLLELQSVYLSYDFNKKLIRRAKLQNLRAAITMNDIFRTSSIEIERGIDSPFARSFTFSIQAFF